MKEIRVNIPEGCKTVTVKVDGENVITEFEPKETEWKPQDGDFLTSNFSGTVVIYAGTKEGGIITYAGLGTNGNLSTEKGIGWGFTKWHRPATEEEKTKLLDKLAEAGYRWNPDKRKLEKLPRWRASKHESYLYVNTFGNILNVKEVNSVSDDDLYKLGNYFRTREAAERVVEQIREIFKNSKAE